MNSYFRLLKGTEQTAFALMSTECGDRTRYPNLANAIAQTWSITFNKLVECDTLAVDILAFISCIERKEIPFSILPKAARKHCWREPLAFSVYTRF